MKIESIREALKAKAQTLSIAPIEKTTTKQDKPVQKDESSVVIPISKDPAPKQPITQNSTEETKPARKPVARCTKSKAKSSPTPDIEAVISEHLRAGVDYNALPRCGKKPVLLKAGAEHLAAIFGFHTTSEVIHRSHLPEKNFMLYEVTTTVYDSDGNILAVGIGSCNTLETKYIKQGFAMSLNTVLKMARKRSYVDAVLSATGSSRVFTQDIEELVAMETTREKHEGFDC